MRSAKYALGAGIVLALVLTGCTASPEDPADASPSASAEPDGAGSSGAVESYDLEDAVATQDVAVPGSEEDTVTVAVFPLEVNGDVQILHFAVTPHFESRADDAEVKLGEMFGGPSGVYTVLPALVDVDNLKTYSVIHEAGLWWKSDEYTSITTNGTPLMSWAVFAAPEDKVDSFEVRLHESWPAFTEVPVQQ